MKPSRRSLVQYPPSGGKVAKRPAMAGGNPPKFAGSCCRCCCCASLGEAYSDCLRATFLIVLAGLCPFENRLDGGCLRSLRHYPRRREQPHEQRNHAALLSCRDVFAECVAHGHFVIGGRINKRQGIGIRGVQPLGQAWLIRARRMRSNTSLGRPSSVKRSTLAGFGG